MPSSWFSTTCEGAVVVLRCVPLWTVRCFAFSLNGLYGDFGSGRSSEGRFSPRSTVKTKTMKTSVAPIANASNTGRIRRQRIRCGSKKTCLAISGTLASSYVAAVWRSNRGPRRTRGWFAGVETRYTRHVRELLRRHRIFFLLFAAAALALRLVFFWKLRFVQGD